jgi:hypothetical protein
LSYHCPWVLQESLQEEDGKVTNQIDESREKMEEVHGLVKGNFSSYTTVNTNGTFLTCLASYKQTTLQRRS